jgi:hypothetical protein
MPVQEINSKYIFTDGEIISFKVDYQVPTPAGFIAEAEVEVKAKHALPDEEFEYVTLMLNFSAITSLSISENFKHQSKISDITLKKLDDGIFYVSLHPFNTSNEPNDRDNFVIKAEGFTFDVMDD